MTDNNAVNQTFTATDWITELRTTQKLQARNYLKIDDGEVSYCCLGIACELSGIGSFWNSGYQSIGEQVFIVGASTQPEEIRMDEENIAELPEEVRRLLGLRTNLGEFKVTHEWLEKLSLKYPLTAKKVRSYRGCLIGLSNLNDDGLTFSEIADVIESNPPGLFI